MDLGERATHRDDDEAGRLDALRKTDLLDTRPEPGYDAIARIAAEICGVPIALVNLVDADRLWNKAACGFPSQFEMPREETVCAHTIERRDILEIADLSLDPRFANNPAVADGPKLRFYAGAPLLTREGHALGALCVMDTKPHRLSVAQRARLEMLAQVVVEMIASRLLVPRAAQHRMAALAAAVDHAGTPLIIFAAEPDGTRACAYANHAFLETFAFEAGGVIGRDPDALFGALTEPTAVDALRTGAPTDTTHAEALMYDGAGRPRAVDMHARSIPTEDGSASSLVVTLSDITDRRAERIKLAQQAERIRSLYLITSMRDLTGYRQVASVLELGLKSLGLDYGYVAQCDAENATLLHTAGRAQIYEAGATVPLAETWLRHALATGDVHAFDSVAEPDLQTRGARHYRGWGPYIVAPIVVGSGFRGAVGFVGTAARRVAFSEADREFVRLIGAFIGPSLERKVQKDKLDALAFYDALTGLPNRAMLFERIDDAIERARRESDGAFAVHYLDLDGFKDVNDSSGHAAGDAILQRVASRLKKTVRESDTVARLGGDEFVVVQRIAHPHDAEVLASHITGALRVPFVIRDGTFSLGASIGIALYPHDGADADALLAEADRTLYRVKTGAKGTSALAVPRLSA